MYQFDNDDDDDDKKGGGGRWADHSRPSRPLTSKWSGVVIVTYDAANCLFGSHP